MTALLRGLGALKIVLLAGSLIVESVTPLAEKPKGVEANNDTTAPISQTAVETRSVHQAASTHQQ